MKILLTISTIAAIIFCLLYLSECEANRNKDKAHEAAKSLWNSDKAIADTVKNRLLTKIFELQWVQEKKDSLHTVNNKAQKRTIAYYIRKERNSRPDTITVELQDTVYLLSAQLVDSLENQVAELKANDSTKTVFYESIISIQTDQIKLADSIISLPVPKQSRVSLGLSAGYGLMATGGEVRAGVFFGPGISYNIPIGKISLRKLFRRK